MKLKQETTAFKPITIILETKEEAMAFLEIMEEVDARTPEARNLAIAMSNAFTECLVEIPAVRTTEYELSA